MRRSLLGSQSSDDDADEENSESETLLTHALMHFGELQEAGTLGSRVDFLSLYPSIRDELDECLNNLDQLQRFAHVMSDVKRLNAMCAPLALPAVLGDYQIVRSVGQGGMGVVYEARQISLDRRLALKILHAGSAMDPRAVARFQNEIQAAALLDHPHIVPVLDVGNHDGIHFYTMRFIDGQSLAEVKNALQSFGSSDELKDIDSTSDLARLKSIQPCSNDHPACTDQKKTNGLVLGSNYFRAIATLGNQAAEALHHAHQQGIVHRDVKPSNLLLDELGNLWVTDFGLARIENSIPLTLTGDMLGTLRYMSPEQMSADRTLVDHRSDVYSLGASLYELSTLEPMIRSTNQEAILREVLYGSPTRPILLHKNYPRDLETILLKATAKDPNDRYSSCHAFAQDLQYFLQSRPIRARRPTPGLRMWRWTQRNPQLARLCLFFLMLATISLLGGAWWANRMYQNAQRMQSERELQRTLAQAAQKNLDLHADVSESIIAFQAWKHHEYSLLRRTTERWRQQLDAPGLERQVLLQVAEYQARQLCQIAGPAYCVRLNHDFTNLLCGGASGVHVLDRFSGEILAHMADHASDVNGVAWSSDGQYLASVGDDGQLLIYQSSELAAGMCRWSLIKRVKVDGALVHAEFLPNARVAACERMTRANGPRPSNSLHVWSLGDDAEHTVLEGPGSNTEGLSVSHDGRLAAVACQDDSVFVWDLEKKELTQRLRIRSFGPMGVSVSSVAFAHRSNLLVVGGRDGTMQLFDAETGRFLQSLQTTAGTIETVAFAPNDDRISLGTREGLIRVFECSSAGQWLPQTEYVNLQAMWSQVFSADGVLFACGALGVINLIDCEQPMERRRIRIEQGEPRRDAAILDVEFAPDGKRLSFVCEDHRIFVCDYMTGAVLATRRLENEVGKKLAYSSDGQMLALQTNSSIRLIDAYDLRDLAEPKAAVDAGWRSLGFVGQDRSFVTSVSGVGLISDQAERIHWIDLPSMVENATKLPESLRGKQRFGAFTPNAFAALLLQSAETLKHLGGRDFEQILGVSPIRTSYAPDSGQFATLCLDNTVRIFRLNSDERPLAIHTDSVYCFDATLSPDGTLLAVAVKDSYGVGLIRLFQATTGRELYSLPHHLDSVCRLCFSPDGQQLIAAGGSIRKQAEIAVWGHRILAEK